MQEPLDLRRGYAGGAQHLDGVPPDLRRECWWNLLLPADLEGARQAYEKALLMKDLKKRRNGAVHRGKIPDPDVEAMLKERNTIDSHRYSLLESKPISDEEHKNLLSDLQETRRLLLALDGGDFVLNPRDRPDVEAAIGGRSIGIEVTVFHGDEEPGRGG